MQSMHAAQQPLREKLGAGEKVISKVGKEGRRDAGKSGKALPS